MGCHKKKKKSGKFRRMLVKLKSCIIFYEKKKIDNKIYLAKQYKNKLWNSGYFANGPLN